MIAKNRKKKTTKERLRFASSASFVPLISVAIFFLIGMILLFSNWQMMNRHKELLLRTEALEKEISFLEERNEGLKTGLISVSEEGYLEKEAREKFQLQKPGEKTVAVLPPEGGIKSVSAEEPKNFFEKILERLGF